MARASDALPFRPYAYGGETGPVIGAPGQVRRADPGPDPEWYRELAAEADAPLFAPPERCRACGYLTTAPGHLIACGDG